jgi:hypothetical protein
MGRRTGRHRGAVSCSFTIYAGGLMVAGARLPWWCVKAGTTSLRHPRTDDH